MFRIALDAGHGFYTKGKRCLLPLDSIETREWILNDRIIEHVIELLDLVDGVGMRRLDDSSGIEDIPIKRRCLLCNEWECDFLLSVHHNAGINGGTGGGTVVLYYPTKDNEKTARKLYDTVIDHTGLRGDRAMKTVSRKDLGLLNGTKCPAFILENGFMDSSTDVPIILSPEHTEQTAKGIVKFLLEYGKEHGFLNAEKCPTCGR